MKKQNNTDEAKFLEYFENHPEVVKMRKLMRMAYAKCNIVEANRYASMIGSLKEKVAKSFIESRERLIDVEARMTPEENHIMALKLNKLMFLSDAIDEAVFSINEILKKYKADFREFDEFRNAAKIGQKHIAAFLNNGNDNVKETFAEFTEYINKTIDDMIEEHIFIKQEEKS